MCLSSITIIDKLKFVGLIGLQGESAKTRSEPYTESLDVSIAVKNVAS